MKAFRAFLVLGLFTFLSFGMNAQSGVNRVNKNEVKSNKAPQKTPSVYQKEVETKAIPAPTPPPAPPKKAVPVSYPNNSTSKPTLNKQEKPTEFKAVPNSSTQKNSIPLSTEQKKGMQRNKK